MHRPCGELREALAVYVLGAIGPADRDAVDRHLPGCAGCRDELAGLAGLPALLRKVSVAEATELAVGGTGRPGNLPSGQVLQSMLARSSRQRGRHLRTMAAAAAVAGLVAGAGVIAGWQAAQPAASSAPVWTGTSQAASQQTRASATVRYAASRWGLRLSVQVTGIPPGTACEMEVINRGGQEVAAGSWTIIGRPGAWYPASAAVPLYGIRGFVLSAGSKTLVRIPVHESGPAGR